MITRRKKREKKKIEREVRLMGRKWAEVVKGKRKTTTYGQQRLSNGNLLRWKVTTKHRRVHYGINDSKFGTWVEYLCGKIIDHNRANYTECEGKVTCPYCLEILKPKEVN
jgi:hypothetical protein